MLIQATSFREQLATIGTELVDGIMAAVPKIVLGTLFLALAYVAIKVILTIARSVFERLYPSSQRLVVDLTVTVIAIFLWFGAALVLLNIVGLGNVAASLGTASGFIGLGVAFALQDMIADTVAGVYLLRDPDFNEGYRVDTASVTGTITAIGLRKTRLRVEDGSLVVLANREVEKRWRLEESSREESAG
ncbi:mechanosensitive ion channel family protein [Haloarcula halophila]|uniref:mechanosensitive ion channel family protein n=1 Tax=Haloarcula TaxID=2237 RepID=UPI0023E434E9|nr:mechanosensitive ion channel domain-containing protein [Halomicroarcula sp. DFY41]